MMEAEICLFQCARFYAGALLWYLKFQYTVRTAQIRQKKGPNWRVELLKLSQSFARVELIVSQVRQISVIFLVKIQNPISVICTKNIANYKLTGCFYIHMI